MSVFRKAKRSKPVFYFRGEPLHKCGRKSPENFIMININ